MPRGQKATGYGAAPGRRNTAARSAKQRTRRALREQDPRIKRSREEIRQSEEELERLAARPSDGPAPGAAYTGMTPRQIAAVQAAGGQIEPRKAVHPVSQPGPTPDDAVERTANRVTLDALRVALKTLPEHGDGGMGWTLGQARSMMREGYHISHVVGATGFDTGQLSDLARADGYGMSLEEWLGEDDKETD